MKNLKYILLFLFIIPIVNTNAQEKKIKFNKGTLKICSTKNFTIAGYNGNEIIIKSLHDKRGNTSFYNLKGNVTNGYSFSSSRKNGLARMYKQKGFPLSKKDSNTKNRVVFFSNDKNREKGLKKLGKKNENNELGIYFTIEQNGDELIFKDNIDGNLIMLNNERYEIKIPNTLKLNWQTNGCKEKEINTNQYVFFNSKTSSLKNFEGEVEISTSLNNMRLTDVTGPVSINSIGGNVTIEFDKKTPKQLYSVYTNNGFIDITLPTNSDINLDASSTAIFSDLDFKVVNEREEEGLQKMKLKLKNGRVKMKLDAGFGNIYLRKR